ncbi:transposase [Agrobacterium vitis]|nr:transposase [Allorhizobium ampelinum]
MALRFVGTFFLNFEARSSSSANRISAKRLTPAVRQITERGYPVSEVSQRLGVSQHSLYEWKKKFSSPTGDQGSNQAEEIRQLKKELAHVTEEPDI